MRIKRNERYLDHCVQQDSKKPESRGCPGSNRHPRGGEDQDLILAASVNPSDVKNTKGKMEGMIHPRIPGRDFAGTVVAGPSDLSGTGV